ncbi:MAG: tRNA uridine-5-carboxymethylaminomethyl(34) synthesis GTPase MnmE [Clostridia bacterium]|nr:tRNA uridine-5-carboxymethylaminomethyl(34) synthesis GTPase MnmE [Clostridia bacterium]
MEENKTIAAISTPVGVGGISVIRVSGKEAKNIASKVFSAFNVKEFNIEPRKMYLGDFKAEQFNEKCMMVWFKAPNSYTGEDVVEFQCHGGTVIAKGVLDALINAGAVLAGPGEFTKRAFINGKLTLDEAEGVMDMINAESESEVRAGYNLLKGNLSKEINEVQNTLTKLIAKIEVVLDYPEHDYEEQTAEETETSLEEIRSKLNNILKTSNTGAIVKNGSKVLILGKPNVGKSSLLNAILNYDRAIVTSIKGTTRDILEETYTYKGVKFILTDTAGLRDAEDEVEKIGVEKAKEAINYADVILLVLDSTNQLEPEDKEILDFIDDKNTIVVKNKTDLGNTLDLSNFHFKHIVEVSALNKRGVEELKQTIYNMVIDENIINSNLMVTNMRHVEAIKKALNYVDDCVNGINLGVTLDVVSIDLKNLWLALGEITGNNNNEEIINEIFSGFCVGK